jgi:hypothetical protein
MTFRFWREQETQYGGQGDLNSSVLPLQRLPRSLSLPFFAYALTKEAHDHRRSHGDHPRGRRSASRTIVVGEIPLLKGTMYLRKPSMKEFPGTHSDTRNGYNRPGRPSYRGRRRRCRRSGLRRPASSAASTLMIQQRIATGQQEPVRVRLGHVNRQVAGLDTVRGQAPSLDDALMRAAGLTPGTLPCERSRTEQATRRRGNPRARSCIITKSRRLTPLEALQAILNRSQRRLPSNRR